MVSAAIGVAGLWFVNYRIFRKFVRVHQAVEALGEPWPYHRKRFRNGEEFLDAAKVMVKGR